ncbi:MAG: AraC family transcriptional regulator [Brevinematales bacterium]|nr:AraC family transcriptional regulator [Brevinematales bacterium]
MGLIKFELIFNIFTVINLAILFLFLFFKKNNSISNKMLALIVINPGLNFINNIFILSGLIYNFHHNLYFSFATALLYGPLVHHYVNLMIGKKTAWFFPLHFLTLLFVILDFYFWGESLFLSSDRKKLYLDGLITSSYPWQMNFINAVFVLTQFVYFIISIFNVIDYSKRIKDFYSDIEKVSLNYIQKFIIVIFLLNVILIMSYVVLPTPIVEYIMIPTLINVIYLYIIYEAFQNSVIFSKIEFNSYENNIKSIYQLQDKTKNLPELSSEEVEEYYALVNDYFYKNKPFLSSILTIEKLADKLKIPKYQLSRVINIKTKRNFFEFINFHRIEEAKKILASQKMKVLSVDAVGYEVGFNSKSAFYRAFKKYTNQTPAQFSKKLKN